MPHLIVEYSTNLDRHIAIADLVHEVHAAALASGLFDTGAVRTRAAPREVYAIADRHPDNAFVAVTVRVAHGRDLETRRRLGKAIFDAVCRHLEDVQKTTPIGISLEVQEMDPVTSFRKSTVRAKEGDRPRRAGVEAVKP